jgi:hypothetical protein
MILEAIVRKTAKGTVFAAVDNKEMTVRQRPNDDDYSNVYHRLCHGEKVFVAPASRTECHLVVNFNNGMEDYFFQAMFGITPPKRDDMTFYQKRIIAAQNAAAQGSLADLFRGAQPEYAEGNEGEETRGYQH